MKHLKTLVAIAIMLLSSLVIVACSNTAKTDLQFFYKKGVDTRLEIHYQKDKVLKEVSKTTVTYNYLDELHQLNGDKKKIKTIIDKEYGHLNDIYKEIKGVTYSYEFQKDQVVVNLEIDYTKLPLDRVNAFTALTDVTTDDYVSYQKLLEHRQEFDNYKVITDGKFQELRK